MPSICISDSSIRTNPAHAGALLPSPKPPAIEKLRIRPRSSWTTLAKKKPPSRDPARRVVGLWSTFEKAILGGSGPTFRLAVLPLVVGGTIYAVVTAANAGLLGSVLRAIFELH